MRRTVLALVLIAGCDFFSVDDATTAEVVVAEAADTAGAAADPAEPPPPPRSDIDQARDKSVAGDHAGARATARVLLKADATNAAAWRLLKHAAVASGQAAAVAGDMPSGPGAGVTKVELLLAAKDAAGAMTAAKSIQADKPNAAAALMARAAMLGADPGELAGKAEALVGFATAIDARSARPFAEAAAAVGGWRAALLRAELATARNDKKTAFAEYMTVTEADSPEATYLGNRGRSGLVKAGGAKKGKRAAGPAKRPAKRVAKWIQAAHDVALAEGWTGDIAKLTASTVKAQLRAERPRKAQADAAAAIERLTVAGANAGPGLSLSLARAALEAGDVVTAATAAATARAAFVDAGKDQKAAEASWMAGQAAHALGRTAALDEAAGQVMGARKDVLKALSLLDAGLMKQARLQFPTDGLKALDAARAYTAAANTGKKGAIQWLDRAISAADKSGRLSVRIQTRLAKESVLRRRNNNAAAKLRAETAVLAPDGVGGSALRAELAARAVLSGQQAQFPLGENRPTVLGAWEALSRRKAPDKAVDEADKGLVQWARGRAAAARGNLEGHDAHFKVALGKLPLHRMGALDTITVLDGSEGVDVDTDLALLTSIKGETAAGMALQAHDVGHRLDSLARDLSLGRQPFASLSDEVREALLAAVARVRGRTLSWLSHGGDYPSDAFVALAEAETAASADLAFNSILPRPGVNLRDFVDELGNGAVLSLRVSRGQVHGVAVSRLGTGIHELGDAKQIKGMVDQYYAALDVAAAQRRKTDHTFGDLLRHKVLDPFIGDLVGVGRYAIVGPPSLTRFPFTVLPEQGEGLRWLADIRQMTTSPSMASLTRDLRTVDQNTFKLDFLGFSADAPKLSDDAMSEYEVPDELKTCSRHFQSGFDETLYGANATVAAWKEKSPLARYIHITGLPAAARGGFMMADGPLTLEQIRSTPMHAELVVITAKTTSAQQMHRARAFLDAGAKWVLVSTWDTPDRTRVRYLSNVYDSMNQERPPVRALSEGRQSLFRDSLTGVDLDDPSLWGGLLLFGMP
jgi:hypothetical protein